MFYLGFLIGILSLFGFEFALMGYQKHKAKKMIKDRTKNL